MLFFSFPSPFWGSVSSKGLLLFVFLLLAGCSSMERSEREKLARVNCCCEKIQRNASDKLYSIGPLEYQGREAYPWESENALPKITKSFFRCKGSPLHPEKLEKTDKEEIVLRDCTGCTHHGLPILRGKQDIYPILIELLNFVQKKSGKRVIVTCGHRCPPHNTYADPSKKNSISKHQIGAEVDFYVQGMERDPEKVVELLLQYFKEHPRYAKDEKSRLFLRRKSEDLNTPFWVNKEVSIHLFEKHEGRDWDNQHEYPYISIEVLYDRDDQKGVEYSWAKAHQGYPRS